MHLSKTIFLWLPLALLPLLASCSATKGGEIAEREVQLFHKRYNRRQFHEIYTFADDGFKKAATEKEFAALGEALHKKLGDEKSSSSAGWNINATMEGTFVTLGYNTDFEDGKGTEQFSFLVKGDQARLLRYNVNSPQLILK